MYTVLAFSASVYVNVAYAALLKLVQAIAIVYDSSLCHIVGIAILVMPVHSPTLCHQSWFLSFSLLLLLLPSSFSTCVMRFSRVISYA